MNLGSISKPGVAPEHGVEEKVLCEWMILENSE